MDSRNVVDRIDRTNNTEISIRNLYKIFGNEPLKYLDLVREGMSKTELNEEHNHVLGLKDINIDMPAGRIQVVMGLSGSGKSTLIRHINRLIEPTAGEVLVGGRDVVQMSLHELREFRRHQTAMVFQRFALLPHRTVIQNVAYGLEIQGLPEDVRTKSAMKWIDRVGLAGYEDNYPNQLSGGMQQRVGLARALANDAPILLMDEAFSALDPLIRVDMQSVLLDLQTELHKTIVFITHDLDEALRLGDQITVLRDGEIVQQGSPQDIVLKPADDYIASFVREVNRGRVIQVGMIATDPTGQPKGMPIPHGTVLEEAAKTMTDKNVTVAHAIDDKGRVIGDLKIHDVISAMVTPIDHEETNTTTDAAA